MSATQMMDPYRSCNGIYVPPIPVVHREHAYDSRGFELLRKMQGRHFWYLGRHCFLLDVVHGHVRRSPGRSLSRRLIDLGGGCGGWLAYFRERTKISVSEMALADSSLTALQMSMASLPADVKRYQVDLLDLQWENRWELIFLLDVLEHIPQDKQVLQQIYRALVPGGYLFVTTPALRAFWTWNDEIVGHQRRYSKRDFQRLAGECGYRLREARYFMFLLSPLLLISRWRRVGRLRDLTDEQRWQLVEKTHEVPRRPLNSILKRVFYCETPLGHYFPFPWGTSILGVFQKPA